MTALAVAGELERELLAYAPTRRNANACVREATNAVEHLVALIYSSQSRP
jgi:hypothetical protein